MENKTCPCCGRHCSLDDPHCERGVQYAKTGIIPEREKNGEVGDEHHEHHGHHDHHEHHGHHVHQEHRDEHQHDREDMK